MILKDTIFRAYDVRGKALEAFDAEGFYILGRAIVRYIGDKNLKVLISGDGRESMGILYPALIRGVQDEGGTVILGGILPSPLNLFAFHEGDFDLALQMTASHNPSYDNGLKIMARKGDISGDDLQVVKGIAFEMIKDESVVCPELSIADEISLDEQDFLSPYIEKLTSVVGSQGAKKVVVDAGNGVSGPFYPALLSSFGHEVIELYCELDTSFPNHQPDPEEVENMQDCRAKVLETGSDFGLVFDGDGDRIGVVLKDGTILSQDKILYCLAADMLSRNPGAKVVVDAMSSDSLEEKLKAIGGDVIRSKTGHSFIKEGMDEHGALFGGEQSGHFMFAENFYGHDDAALAALRFIQAVEENPSIIDEVTIKWPEVVEYSEKFVVDDEKKFEIMDQYVQTMKTDFPEASTIDGIRISFGGGEWAIVRPSNTSPKISVRIEGTSKESLEEKKELLIGPLNSLVI